MVFSDVEAALLLLQLVILQPGGQFAGSQFLGSQLTGLQLAFVVVFVWLTVLTVAVFASLVVLAVLLFAQAVLFAVHAFLVIVAAVAVAVPLSAFLAQAVFLAQHAGLD